MDKTFYRKLFVFSAILLTGCQDAFLPDNRFMDAANLESADNAMEREAQTVKKPIELLPYNTYRPKELSKDTYTLPLSNKPDLKGLNNEIRTYIDTLTRKKSLIKDGYLEYRATPSQQGTINTFLEEKRQDTYATKWHIQLVSAVALPQPSVTPLVDLVPLGEKLKVYTLERAPDFMAINAAKGQDIILSGNTDSGIADFKISHNYVESLTRNQNTLHAKNQQYHTGISTEITPRNGILNLLIKTAVLTEIDENRKNDDVKRTPKLMEQNIVVELPIQVGEIYYIIGLPQYADAALLMQATKKSYGYAEKPEEPIVKETKIAPKTMPVSPKPEEVIADKRLTELKKQYPHINNLIDDIPAGKIIFKDAKKQNLPPVTQQPLNDLSAMAAVPQGLTDPRDIAAFLEVNPENIPAPKGSATASANNDIIATQNLSAPVVKRIKRIRLSEKAFDSIMKNQQATEESSQPTSANSLKSRLKQIAPQNGIIVLD